MPPTIERNRLGEKGIKNMFTEHQIQTHIINFLRAKGFYVMRLNTGKYSVGEGRFKRFVLGQEKGTPDLMAFRKGECDPAELGNKYDRHADLIFIEVKRPGNKPTIDQVYKMEELEEYGATCFVATSIEEVAKKLNLPLY